LKGTHFPHDAPAEDIGYKIVAVNLSDIAAMGATPCWVNLALSLPRANADWLHAFTTGMQTLLAAHQCPLIGGDVTRGPLVLSLTAMGQLPLTSKPLLRSGAKPGDHIFVTGNLGDAGLGLRALQGQMTLAEADYQYALQRYYRPMPRVALGAQLLGIANAMIDISDGLVSDLGHIVNCSQVGAEIYLAQLPQSQVMQGIAADQALALMLAAGDDYELCFTVPENKLARLEQLRQSIDVPITAIGTIQASPGVKLLQADGNEYKLNSSGYQHF
jgi:thiamine-monophosphate kinase